MLPCADSGSTETISTSHPTGPSRTIVGNNASVVAARASSHCENIAARTAPDTGEIVVGTTRHGTPGRTVVMQNGVVPPDRKDIAARTAPNTTKFDTGIGAARHDTPGRTVVMENSAASLDVLPHRKDVANASLMTFSFLQSHRTCYFNSSIFFASLDFAVVRRYK